MENDYRIPNVSEFKQGFEFEILKHFNTSFIVFDVSDENKSEEISTIEEDKWIKLEFILDSCGEFINFFFPYGDNQLIKLIEDGKIRARK